jgi:hypothetical protein
MPDVTPSAEPSADTSQSFEDVVTEVAEATLPGSGTKLEERVAAFEAVVTYLREHGTATPAELKDEVYSTFPAQYQSARSWWKNAMYKALRELADRTDRVEKADTSGEWRYVDGRP